MGSAFLIVVLFGALVIVLIITLAFQILRLYQKRNPKYRTINILVSLFLSTLATWTIYIPHDLFLGKPILKAEIQASLDIGRLTLREKNKYSAEFGHIDWVCSKNGNFKIKNDTLFLEKEIEEISNKVISSEYLFGSNNYLIPIKEKNHTIDSSHWMVINENKNWR